MSDAKRGLEEKYFKFYNQNRPHTALDDKTPDEFYFDSLPTCNAKNSVGINRKASSEMGNTVLSSGATSF